MGHNNQEPHGAQFCVMGLDARWSVMCVHGQWVAQYQGAQIGTKLYTSRNAARICCLMDARHEDKQK